MLLIKRTIAGILAEEVPGAPQAPVTEPDG